MSSVRRRTRYTAENYKKIVNFMKAHKIKESRFSDGVNKYLEYFEKQLEESSTEKKHLRDKARYNNKKAEKVEKRAEKLEEKLAQLKVKLAAKEHQKPYAKSKPKKTFQFLI
jgi:hypothetical protein